ncbi:hypothetical protein D3C76_1817420 [compost metagenome]
MLAEFYTPVLVTEEPEEAVKRLTRVCLQKCILIIQKVLDYQASTAFRFDHLNTDTLVKQTDVILNPAKITG